MTPDIKVADLTLDEALALVIVYDRMHYADPRRVSWHDIYQRARTLIDEHATAAVVRALDRRLSAALSDKEG